MASFGAGSNEFRFVGDWIGALRRCRLKEPDEDNGALPEGATHDQMLAGLLAPLEVGLLYKKACVLSQPETSTR